MIGVQVENSGERVKYQGVTYGWNSYNQPSKMVEGSWKPIMSHRYPEMPMRFRRIVLIDLIKVEVKK